MATKNITLDFFIDILVWIGGPVELRKSLGFSWGDLKHSVYHHINYCKYFFKLQIIQ